MLRHIWTNSICWWLSWARRRAAVWGLIMLPSKKKLLHAKAFRASAHALSFHTLVYLLSSVYTSLEPSFLFSCPFPKAAPLLSNAGSGTSPGYHEHTEPLAGPRCGAAALLLPTVTQRSARWSAEKCERKQKGLHDAKAMKSSDITTHPVQQHQTQARLRSMNSQSIFVSKRRCAARGPWVGQATETPPRWAGPTRS